MSTDNTLPSFENTYILDPESAAEMARLIRLDQITTQAMGGPLANLPLNPANMTHILDIGCGPGGWVLDVAYSHPYIEVMGIDISRTMTQYASARALTQRLSNASFGIMSALEPLDFGDGAFDMVNLRFVYAFMPASAWKLLLQECTRILRPGGVLCLTEADNTGVTNSPAFERLSAWAAQAMLRAGYGTPPDGHTVAITPMLRRLLADAGLQQVELQSYVIDWSSGMPANADIYHNVEVALQGGLPLMVRMGVVGQQEADQVAERVLIEMLSEDFCAIWTIVSAWGVKP